MAPITDPDLRSVKIKCLKVSQPVGDFFIGSMSYEILTQIADFDVRRVISEQRDVERYLGIQRPLNKSRVSELEKYVEFYDATFPTSIIIAVDSDCVFYDEKKSEMTLSSYRSEDDSKVILYRHIARVLDGQHRIAGLFKHNGNAFDLNVTIFVGIDIAQQAQIFSTVNLEQTKVNKSLAYDLFALAKSRSPHKTCHNVVVALDQEKDGPFFKRIKRLGSATEGRYGETLTQATFVDPLVRLISADPKGDRDTILRGGTLPEADENELLKYPFRNLFLRGNDLEIADIISTYFRCVRETWPTAWNAGGRGMILNKTNGFRALMRVFKHLYLYTVSPGSNLPHEACRRIFLKSNTQDDYFSIDNFPPGTSGEAQLYHYLMQDLKLGE